MQVKTIDSKKPHIIRLFSISIISLIMVLGLFFRIYNLSSQPYWMDEGYTINAILSIRDHGSTLLDSGNYYSCPTYCYPTHYLTKVFGDNPFSYRLLSVISGILLVLISYLIIKKIVNHKVALLSSFFLAFSYYEIAWSRQARWYTLFSLFFIVATYFFYKVFKEKKIKYYILTAIFTILTIFTHSLGIILPFSFLIFIFIENIKNNKIKLLKNSIFVIVISLALIVFDYLSGIKLISTSLKNLSLHFNLLDYLVFYIKNYSIFIILLIASFFVKHNYKEYSRLLLIILLSYLIPLSFFTNLENYRYLFQIVPIIFILSSISLDYILEKIKPIKYKIIIIVSIILLYFLLNIGVIYPRSFYYLESDIPSKSLIKKNYYSYTPQPNWNEAYKMIQKNKKDDEIVISNEPQFNKIFLNEAGYYLKYTRDNITNQTSDTKDNKEFYVNAKIINNIQELKDITNIKHGYIIFDYLFVDKDNDLDMANYINQNFKLIYFNNINEVSRVWVYKF